MFSGQPISDAFRPSCGQGPLRKGFRRGLVLTLTLHFWVGFGLMVASSELRAEDAAAAEPAPAVQVSPTYRKLVSDLLSSIGAEGASEAFAMSAAQETLAAIAATGTQVTEEIQKIVVDEALAEFSANFGGVDYLTDVYAPLYAQHLSEQNIRDILAFYQSEAGQKMIEVVPQISQTAMYTMQQNSLARIPDFQTKVDAKLRAIGIIIAP